MVGAWGFEPQTPTVSTHPSTLKNINNIGHFLTIARLPAQLPAQFVCLTPGLEGQILNDTFQFNHIAARDNHFKIIDHLADGQSPGNNDNTSNLFGSGNSARAA